MTITDLIGGLPTTMLAVLLFLIACLLGFVMVEYVRAVGLDRFREDVYKLFLEAEHAYWETGSGKLKMEYVVQKARSRLPAWLKFFLTDKILEEIIQSWFDMVKDLLDDGKINRSSRPVR